MHAWLLWRRKLVPQGRIVMCLTLHLHNYCSGTLQYVPSQALDLAVQSTSSAHQAQTFMCMYGSLSM